jgi:metal-dependent HD superfamily phosphatase/phosphodiesterase
MSNILSIPTRGNEKLERLLSFVDTDIELQTLWRCSNIVSMDRMGYNDHGPIHVKIVANRGLKMLRILLGREIAPNIVKNYGMTVQDAEVVVVLGALLHDLGLSIIRDQHEIHSVPLALGILNRFLPLCYKSEEKTVMTSEVLHAVIAHHEPNMPVTIEAGIVKVADALDMERGRARIPFEAGRFNIHSVSAFAIKKVDLLEGVEKPITIRIEMSNPAGIFQIDNLLKAKIKGSNIEEYLHVEVAIVGEDEIRVPDSFEF